MSRSSPNVFWSYVVGALVAASLVLSAAIVARHYLLKQTEPPVAATAVPVSGTSSSHPPALATATPAATATAAAATAPTATIAPSASAAAIQDGEGATQGDDVNESEADGGAVKALKDFRQGIVDCVEQRIGQLPGTSRPVPRQLAHIGVGGYRSQPHVWSTPVYHCARYSLDGIQRFQLQWQLADKSKGRGVARVDADGDGAPEASYSFEVELLARAKAKAGPIQRDTEPRPIR